MAEPARRTLTVWAGGAQMRIDASIVAEVIRQPAMTRAPHGPKCLMGITHHRGSVLPIISASDLLRREGPATERVVVLRGGAPVGLAVEKVGALEVLEQAQGQGDGRRILEDLGGEGRIDLDEVLLDQFAFAARMGDQNTAHRNTSKGWAEQEQSPTRAFLGFLVSGQVFCIPLEAVKEVADVQKEGLSAQDLQRQAIERRGEILPLISAGALLGLPDSAAGKLVILGAGARDLGLVVDRIDAVIRLAEDRIVGAPSLFNRGDAEALIGGVLRMSDGRGVVSVLSPERLVAHGEALPGTRRHKAPATSPTAAVSSRRFLVLALGDALYGLPMDTIGQVIRKPARMARPPKAPSNLKGVIRLRGDFIPVIDVGDRLGPGEACETSRVVVVSVGPSSAGLLVDRVEGTIDVRSRNISAPEADKRIEPLLEGVCERDGRTISLIEPSALLRSVEQDLAREMARGFAAP